MRRPLALASALSVAVTTALATVAWSPTAAQEETGPFDVVMVTWRGCEAACEGFWDYLESTGVETRATILDAGQDRERLPGFVDEIEAMDPDLVVTWGTSVTLGIVGPLGDTAEPRIGSTPTVFMIVADPVGAGIIEDRTTSGRAHVTGTHNRVPEAVQMRVLADYLSFQRVGLIYNDDELNAVLKADEVRRVGAEQGFEVVERVLAAGIDGAPLADDIPRAVADVAAAGVEAIYVGSSSFLLDNADLLTRSALEHGLPVATAYEAMVRDSDALIALGSAYYNVGQLAGYQAERVLREGAVPGELEVLGLDRFSVVVNMDAARALGLYPPMLLLRFAEVVSTDE